MSDWRELANCRGTDPDIFFPQRGTKNQHYLIHQAVEICHHCEVRPECLETHLYEKQGIWGGMPERQRRNYRTKYKLKRAS